LIKQHGGKIVYRLIVAGIGVAVAAILSAGCGGGGSDQATAQISEAQFIKQVKTICAKTHKEVGAVFFGQSASGKADPIEQIALLLKQESEALDALAGPEEVEAKVAPLIENVSKASGILAQEGKKALNDQRVAAYKQEAEDLHLPNC
jgi:Fe-S cluster biogenesis protein NfuA